MSSCIRIFLFALTGSVYAQEAGPWQRLFNGADLREWSYQDSYWSVADGVLRGEGKAPVNTYCFLPSTYSDFVLVMKSRLWQTEAGYTNSGIQYRSAFIDSSASRMKGYQWDIGDGWDGSVYPEGQYPEGMTTLRESAECEKANRRNEWNQVVIIADGKTIRHELNGTRCVEYQADLPSGHIGLQLHATRIVMRVEFKDIYIRPLRGAFAVPASSAFALGSDYAPVDVAIKPLGRRGGKGPGREVALPFGPGKEIDLRGRRIRTASAYEITFGLFNEEE
jgi:hypothetical protein